jgi:hypothetical protein
MTPDEKKRKFEEDLIEVAVAEYYQWVEVHQNYKVRMECKNVL